MADPRSHPYTTQPDRAFWSRAVASSYSASAAMQPGGPLMRSGDRVISAGSCFASNLPPYLEQHGIAYLRTEPCHPAFAHLPDNLGYRNFSAAYGNIYTVRQLRQLMDRSIGLFRPKEDRWHVGKHVVDPFRPGLRYAARSDIEFDVLTAQHLRATRRAFEQCTVFVFTLGLTEAWVSSLDGAVFPACPGTVAGEFDPGKHVFHNFTVEEVKEDLRGVVRRFREINPAARVILTVSPVPLVATATDQHVLLATAYSKSVLRVAAGEIAAGESNVSYFPAYEIVTGPQAPHDYFEADRRNVSKAGVGAVMSALLAHCAVTQAPGRPAERQEINGMEAGTSALKGGASLTPGADAAAEMSRLIADAECEEAMVDVKENPGGSGQA